MNSASTSIAVDGLPEEGRSTGQVITVVSTIVLIGLIGLGMNGLCLYHSMQKPYNHTAFGLFLASKAFSNNVGILIFIFWSLPLTINPDLVHEFPPTVAYHIGITSQAMDASGTFFHLLIAINRSLRLLPLPKLKPKFAHHIHVAGVAVVFGMLVGAAYVLNILAGSVVLYDPIAFQWKVLPPTTFFSNSITYYFFVINVLSFIFDVITLVMLHRASLTVRQSYNKNFFYLLFCQHILYLFDATFIAYVNTSSVLGNYFLQFFLWQCCYAFDGMSSLSLEAAQTCQPSPSGEPPETAAVQVPEKPSNSSLNTWSSRNLFVSNLAYNVTTRSLERYFSTFGKIQSIRLPRQDASEKNRGFAFITFVNNASAEAVLKHEGDGRHDIDGRWAKVTRSTHRSSEAPEKSKERLMPEKVSRDLFVGNLAYAVTGDTLIKYFSAFGEVESARVPQDGPFSTNRGFGFITFVDLEGATAALKHQCDAQHKIEGRTAYIRVCNPQEQMIDRPVKFFVSPLRSHTTSGALRKYFEKFGEITDAYVVYEKVNGKTRSRRMGYVTFDDPEVAEELRDWRRMHVVDGSRVRIEIYNHEKEVAKCTARYKRRQALKSAYKSRPENGNAMNSQRR
ncbi:hypothetical protein QR680_014621 [Steinernema hermaphroditum]|uniref:RRM domain-containing protein n=1 Tax=Steinernema hermaphroditum TaxID=289476 RepID=A0AA39M4K9_9BILA|nr:hypothetical protein QR680_014621 [Steinernema hermaphroditum]